MGKLRAYLTPDKILIICAALLLYGITLKADYSIDDSFVTKKGNLTTEGLRAIPKLISTNYGTDESGQNFDYRPVVKVSFAIEHQFFGVSAGVSHFFNVFIYMICLLLLYRLLKMVVNEAQSRIPLYVVLLFALLPIHTEVVASIKNRDILLSFLFLLLTALTVYKAELRQRTIWPAYVAAGFFLFLALLAKFDAVTGIATVPALVFVKLKPPLKRKILLVLTLIGGFVASRAVAHSVSSGVPQRGYSYFENPLFLEKGFFLRVIALFNSFGFYLVQCAFPFKQSCYYGVESIEIRSLSLYGWLGIFSAAGLTTGLVYAYRKGNMDLVWGLFFFAASLSMFLNFVKPAVGIVADRFAFFGSLGFCLSTVFLLEPYFTRASMRNFFKWVAILIVCTYSFMTLARNREWRNASVMIQADIKKYPESSYLNYLYATTVMDSLVRNRDAMAPDAKTRKIAEIKAHLLKSIRISNDYPKAYDFLSSVMVFLTKEYKEALPYINRGLVLHQNPDLLYYKGVCLQKLGMRDSAEHYLRIVINTNPSMFSAYTLLSESYNASGQYQRSVELFNNALETGIENEFIYTGLASAYLQMGDTLDVVFYAQRALGLNPEYEQARVLLQKTGAPAN